MANSYTTLWTNDLCRELQREGYAGERLSVLFGGPHQSLPSFRSAGVQPGDRIHPIRLFRRKLYVLGALDVARLMPYEDTGSLLDDDDYAKVMRWRPLKAGCVGEVVFGPPGAPLSFGTAIPGDLLERLTYTSRRGERTLRNVVDGELLHHIGVHGVYRLAPASAHELDRLVRAAADFTVAA
ncbi:hypothetical protein [Streptomyces sp. N35]|uniref:hypothetical protein n=1 Tax=Streptomyces sp. N35 TaxID=2795730 RepID=UPI001F15D92B|nr:hypothetical protein [Streptomyces sp. N35]